MSETFLQSQSRAGGDATALLFFAQESHAMNWMVLDCNNVRVTLALDELSLYLYFTQVATPLSFFITGDR